MQIHKVESTDGFIAFDLPDAERSHGVTRVAKKVLVDGAELLARSTTYAFASFELRFGGASAGVNAVGDGRDEAVAAFVEEAAQLVSAGRWVTDPGVGLSEADLLPLRAHDPRPKALWEEGLAAELAAMGAVAAAAAYGDLTGRRVVVDGLAGPELLGAIAAAGGQLVALTTAAGAAVADLDDPSAAWESHGPGLVNEVGGEQVSREKALTTPCDVVFAAGRAGSIDHDLAAGIDTKLVVPASAVPVTARALAALSRNDAVLLPDFVTTAAPLLAGFDLDAGDPIERVAAAAAALAGDGVETWMTAVQRAEEFLAGWLDELPFGRPLS